MKEIKDYLHLYLGCEAAVDYHENKKEGMCIDIITGVDKKYAYTSNLECVFLKNVQPTLRPLSDMTEGEKNDFVTLLLDDSAPNIYVKQAAITVFLLSKHFDLFGLIESGLAIDKSNKTIKT